MAHFDVCNGDADGLCALQQLRLCQPRQAHLVTGVKRDIALLARVDASRGDSVMVLDISLLRNIQALQPLLDAGVAIEYFDHHATGEIPRHPLFTPHLDTSAQVCTCVLVDAHLAGAQRGWAAVGAFGDNLPQAGERLAAALQLDAQHTARLRRLGEAINYNAYGETESDLLVAPARLAQLMRPFRDPLVFLAEEPLAGALCRREAQDLALAQVVQPAESRAGFALYLLPNAPWARRVQGSFANRLSQQHPGRAHAVLCPASGGHQVVSVRAPRRQPRGADTLCLAFATGGGRASAAGIDQLPPAQIDAFIHALARTYPAAA
jgi:hypothetical protein